MADTGPAVDSAGNIYLLDANGDFGTTLDANGFPSNGNFGNAFLKISTTGGLAVADYFEMSNQQPENDSDRRSRLRRSAGAARSDRRQRERARIWPSAPEKTVTFTWSTGTPWASSTPAATIFTRI